MPQWLTDPRINALFAELLELEAHQHSAFVDEACGGDEETKALLLRLLEASDAPDELLQPGGALDSPIWDDNTLRPERSPLTADQQVGPYHLIEVIADGGMATVYLADRVDGLFEQQVALKLVRPATINDEVIRRFDQERQILATLNHPNIARISDGGVADTGAPYLVMEYIHGESIIEYCDRHRLTITQRLSLFVEVARAIDYAHQNLILHLDIKPSNILVTSDGVPKLLDFGIAKLLDPGARGPNAPLTRASARPMTPEYASPEQIRGDALTTASDIYQLGVLLFRLLAGELPQGRDLVSLSDPPPLSTIVARADSAIAENRRTTQNRLQSRLRGDLDTIVLTTLRKEPDRRYGTVRQLIEDIERHLAHEPVTARPDTVSYRVGRFARRNAASVATSALVFLVIVGLTTFYTIQLAAERDRAQLEAEKSEQIATFLVDLFDASDPRSPSRGETVSARELLDAGAMRIETDLAEQPELQASLALTIASVYAQQGEYDKAEQLLDRSYALRREILGDDHPDTIKTMGELAPLYYRQGRYQESEELSRKTYEAATKVFGESHYLTLRFLSSIGLAVWRQSRFDEAELIQSEVLATRLRVLGDQHRDVVSAYNNLAGVYMMQGRLDDAADTHAKAHEAGRRILGSDHPHTLDALNNLAMDRLQQGRYAEAEPLFEEVIELRRKILGGEHPRTIGSLNNLANVYVQRGLFEKAEALFLQCLELRRKTLGDSHLETLWSAADLADVYNLQGRYSEAESLYRETLSKRRETLGDDHYDTQMSMLLLAELLEKRAAFEEAESLYREIVDRQESSVNPEHMIKLRAQGGLGRLLATQGQLDEAQVLLEDTLAGARTNASQDPFLIGTTLGIYGYCLTKLRKFEQAESVLSEALETISPVDELGHVYAEDIIRYTADLYDAWNKPDLAESFREKLAGLKQVE